MERDLGVDLVRRFQLFEVHTQAASKAEYLLRPDLGRRLNDDAREMIRKECPAGCVVQVAIGDGLSAAAIRAQVPRLLPLLDEEASRRGWSFGRPFFIRHCRVGVLNDIGDILDPQVVILLIGERPGLATAESLSAYLAYRPRSGHTDAQRNLISNIHARGVGHEEAARRIVALAEQMQRRQMSGFAVKEEFPPLTPLSPVLGGEGLGVRGRLSPSPPTPLPRVQGRGEKDRNARETHERSPRRTHARAATMSGRCNAWVTLRNCNAA